MNEDMYLTIKNIAQKYENDLKKNINIRIDEMRLDDRSHHLIYSVLGINSNEGNLIDVYQNKGRFLYKAAGSFLEEAALMCFKYRYPDAQKVRIENNIGMRPKNFEIDCLVEKNAYEIKWRDATTDGDHITKEHTRVQAISKYGYKPIRIMFYYPNRKQAQNIQQTLETLYNGIGGEYYYGDKSWDYIKKMTGVDLLEILKRIACEKEVYGNK